MKYVKLAVRIAVWVLAVLAVVYIGQKLYDMVRREYVLPLKYEPLVEKYAAENELPPDLVYAIIKTESSFNAKAESDAGAVGLMQLMPETYEYLTGFTGEEYNLERLKDPETNIRYGCMLLGKMRDRFGTGDEMLAAYNAGEGRVAGWLQDPAYSENGRLKKIPYEETREYVRRVREVQKQYLSLYGAEQEW